MVFEKTKVSKVFAAGAVGLGAVAAIACLAIVLGPSKQDIASIEPEGIQVNVPDSAATDTQEANSDSAAVSSSRPSEQGLSESDLQQYDPADQSSRSDEDDQRERRAREIDERYASIGPRQIGQQLDRYILEAGSDDSWELAAKRQLTEWFLKNFPDAETLIGSECVLDACYIDVEMVPLEMMVIYKDAGQAWEDEPATSFLRSTFAVRAGERFYRVYFFRDSFEISGL